MIKRGKSLISYFIDNDEQYPVIATTSRLLSTGVDAKTCKLIVLDQTINSMSQFKQIVGRGTRIREDYNKLYFTIMDFKGATRLFQDQDFDGEPVTVYEPNPDEPIIPPDYEGEDPEEGRIGDPPTPGEEVGGDDEDDGGTGGGRVRYVLDDVHLQTAIEPSQYLDENGRLITEDYRVLLKDQIKEVLRREFATLDDFLRRWSESERQQAVIDELREQGITLEVLRETVPGGEQIDAFDLVSHIAFDQPPLTRKERAEKVKKRNYFAKYGDPGPCRSRGPARKIRRPWHHRH